MRKFRKKINLRMSMFLLLMVSAFLLAGCESKENPGSQEKSGKQEASESTGVDIGICFDSFVIERWLRDRDVFTATAQELGAKVNVQNANGDVSEQISEIRYLIDKKMDVIVIIAIDASRLKDVIREAKDKGIKVICYDRLILDSGADLYISFDNEKVGTLMAQALEAALPDGGDIFEILGSQSDNNVSQVKKGFEDELKGSGLNIVYSTYCDNWLAELASDAVEEGLSENGGKVDGVMCGNDDLAGQAIKALTENRLAGKVPVTGQDADLAGCQRIVEGTQTMSVYKSVEDEARIAARFAVALGEGKDITSEDGISGPDLTVTDTISDGTYEVPYYSIEPVAVDRDNIDSVIIDGGFHLREDVYMNVGDTDKNSVTDTETEAESG